MPTTTYGDISPRTAAFAAKRLLRRGQALLVTERWGQVDPQGQKKTKTRTWRRYEALSPAIAPLAEGIPPAGQKLTYTDVEAVLEQFGDLVEITDVIQDTHEDPVLMEAMDLCGEQAAETIELLRLSHLKAGTNVFYAGGTVTTRGTVTSPPTRGDFRRIKRALQRNRARMISRMIKAGPNVATEPVAEAYWALGHTDLDSDLRNVPGFVPVEQYANASKAVQGEIGKIESTRIVLTSLVEPWLASGASGTTYLSNGTPPSVPAACDVYPLLVFARDAYGIVPLQGKRAVKPMVLNPGQPRGGDPLGQKGSVGWKHWQAVAILNQLWMARLECACTANPE